MEGGGGEKGEGVCVFLGVFLTRISQAFTPRRHFEGRTFFFFFFSFLLFCGGGGGGGEKGRVVCLFNTDFSAFYTPKTP